jgi:ABC-type branched-subunit amino acid transport system substrate-binding protein
MNQTANRRPLRVGACLSLTGPFSRFGAQAAAGLRAWQRLDGGAEVLIEDDGSDPARLVACLGAMARRCDLLLGPYSTRLMRAAAVVIAETGGLVWNHGGSGDDVEAAAPGHIVSVLAPTSRYATPFLQHLAAQRVRLPLWVVEGEGSFGRQVSAGAQALAGALGLETVRTGPGGSLPAGGDAPEWDLLCAGSFEEDVATVTRARSLPRPPRRLCAVAAGVHDFGTEMTEPGGIHGVAQWFPGREAPVELGPAEKHFLATYSRLTDRRPDYPAVQAAAAAVLAGHCARTAGDLRRESLWAAAAGLDTTTLFGAFRIDPRTGVQTGHETVLVRWTPQGMMPAS